MKGQNIQNHIRIGINRSQSDNCVSLTITEAYFGGGRLAISYIIETEKTDLKSFAKDQGNAFSFHASLNEKPLTYMACFEQNVKDGVARGILDMGLPVHKL